LRNTGFGHCVSSSIDLDFFGALQANVLRLSVDSESDLPTGFVRPDLKQP